MGVQAAAVVSSGYGDPVGPLPPPFAPRPGLRKYIVRGAAPYDCPI